MAISMLRTTKTATITTLWQTPTRAATLVQTEEMAPSTTIVKMEKSKNIQATEPAIKTPLFLNIVKLMMSAGQIQYQAVDNPAIY